MAVLKTLGGSDAVLALGELKVKGRDAYAKTRLLVEILADGGYLFDRFKSEKAEAPALTKITLLVEDADRWPMPSAAPPTPRPSPAAWPSPAIWATCRRTCATRASWPTRPRPWPRRNKNLKVEVLDEKKLKELGMGAFLAVAQGSEQPPRLIVLDYKGGKKDDAPFVLVGKGITFDTGGISLKPGAGHGRDEVRHVRRRQRARHLPRPARAATADQRGGACWPAPRTCPAAAPPAPATSSPP